MPNTLSVKLEICKACKQHYREKYSEFCLLCTSNWEKDYQAMFGGEDDDDDGECCLKTYPFAPLPNMRLVEETRESTWMGGVKVRQVYEGYESEIKWTNNGGTK